MARSKKSEPGSKKTSSGKAKGGIARAKKLTPEQRKKIAQKGAAARKANASLPLATHIGDLPIGEMLLACAVLPDGTRLISQSTIGSAFGPVIGGWQMRKMEESGGLPPFLVAGTLQPFIDDDLRSMVTAPVKYRDPRGGQPRLGYEATVLPKLCEVWLKAREAGSLAKNQEPVAMRAEVLTRALAKTGIIALVDESTGYQEDRARDALSKILQEFIAKELQPWIKTFPPEFYENLFRLRGLEYDPKSVKRPAYFGYLTNNIVYDRLAPGVRKELSRVVPRNKDGKPTAKYFQKLTANTGYPKLKEHLGKVVAYMQLSDDYADFMAKLDRLLPKFDETLPIPLDFSDDNGKGL